MSYHPYLAEQLAQAHRQELLHDAEQQRLLARLPRRHPAVLGSVMTKLGAFLLGLTSPAKQVELPVRTATGDL